MARVEGEGIQVSVARRVRRLGISIVMRIDVFMARGDQARHGFSLVMMPLYFGTPKRLTNNSHLHIKM